jgi:hypothetical protein
MKEYETVDVIVPALEEILLRGGSGPAGFDQSRVLGVEVVEAHESRVTNECYHTGICINEGNKKL